MSSLILFISLQAQPPVQPPGASYYVYLGGPGELQIKVAVWGETRAPGLYSIPDGTDLATLLSVAGGPSEGAELSQVKIIHCFPTPSVTIVNMRDFFNTGSREDIPIMKPGDMVRIKKTFYAKVKESTYQLVELTLLLGVWLQLYTALK